MSVDPLRIVDLDFPVHDAWEIKNKIPFHETLARQGMKIPGIKALRTMFPGMMLKEAKDLWEELEALYQRGGLPALWDSPRVKGGVPEQLEALVEPKGLRSLVHALKSQEADQVINAGTRAQLHYAIKALGSLEALYQVFPYLREGKQGFLYP